MQSQSHLSTHPNRAQQPTVKTGTTVPTNTPAYRATSVKAAAECLSTNNVTRDEISGARAVQPAQSLQCCSGGPRASLCRKPLADRQPNGPKARGGQPSHPCPQGPRQIRSERHAQERPARQKAAPPKAATGTASHGKPKMYSFRVKAGQTEDRPPKAATIKLAAGSQGCTPTRRSAHG